MDKNITAIVNIFRRTYSLETQIKAIQCQTIPPKHIILWNNGNKEVDLSKYKEDPFFKVFDCNYNSGVWPRFLISQVADTEYVCIFDDDTIPGVNWFKNCMDCMKQKEALYGTIGVIFKNSDKYEFLKRYGWDGNCGGNNTVPKPVDIVGHSWFFKKEWISHFTREPPKVNEYFSVGEDINFSFMLQKYANISTYVPPHPSNNLSMFGSIPQTARKMGCDGNSGSNLISTFDIAYDNAVKNGFNTLVKRQTATSSSDLTCFIDKIRNNIPFAVIRPADGEYHILNNSTLTNIDNWTFVSGGSLCKDLNDAVHLAAKKNCYIGIPCGHCNLDMAKWYISTYNIHPLYTTFANIFVNKNWNDWIQFLTNEKNSFIFVGPKNLPSNFFVQKYINIPLYLTNDWDKDGKQYLDTILDEVKKHKNKLFLFSGGPVSKILIAYAWDIHPHNIYLDVGSSLDIFAKGSTNRHYVYKNQEFSQVECKFDKNLINI
jgi:hypothetical protein